MEAVRRLISQLATLLDDKDFELELKAFRSAYLRLRIRLRNNQLIAHLKQLATSTRQLRDKFSTDIIKTYSNQLTNDGKKLKRTLKSIQTHIKNFIEFVDNVLRQTLFVYGYTQQHFRVGHLVHHYIVLRTCISRFRICLKALLVYSCDLYTEIIGLGQVESELTKDQLDEILNKHECKPRNLSAIVKTKDEIEVVDIGDEVGVLINRDTMQAETSSKKKKIKLK